MVSRLRARSADLRVFRSTIIVASLTLVVSAAILARDLVIAALFGTGGAVDAYLIAVLIPQVAINVIAGSISSSLVPIYIRVQQREGAESAQRLLAGAVSMCLGLLVLVTILLGLLNPWIVHQIGAEFDPDKRAVTLELSYALLPIVVISGIATIGSAALNARERFAIAALAPILVPCTSTLFLLSLHRAWGIRALAVGIVVGHLLQLGVLALLLQRQGISLWPRWPTLNASLRQVLQQYVAVFVAAILVGSTLFVDQAIAARLPSGSVATLNYGNKLFTLLTGLASFALGTTMLSHFSRLLADQAWEELSRSLMSWGKLIIITLGPLTLALVLFSEPLVRLLLQRGAFDAADTTAVARVQALFILQLPLFTLNILLIRLISSLGKNHWLIYQTALSAVLNALLDIVLVRFMGVAGIALATTLVQVAVFGFLSVVVRRLLRHHAQGSDMSPHPGEEFTPTRMTKQPD
jgi:putative peptidoglycan lipid II flippase